jgi:hypothetical protein
LSAWPPSRKPLGKRDCTKAVQRVLGSVGWVNAVRSAWVVTEREEDDGKRLLLPVKANLAPRRLGLTYQLAPLSGEEQEMALVDHASLPAEDLERLKQQLYRVRWLGETDAKADAVFAEAARRRDLPSDTDKAVDWLKEYLSRGPVQSLACVNAGKKALGLDKGLKWWRETILKDRLQGQPRKLGFRPEDAVWYFTLPGHPWPPPNAHRDSSPSSTETREKSTRQTRGMLEESEESEEGKEYRDNRCGNLAGRAIGDDKPRPSSLHAWVSPDADLSALDTPFEQNGESHVEEAP